MLFALAACCLQSQSTDATIERYLRELTLEQKIDLLSGIDDFYTKKVGSIPSFKMSDGPAGVRTWGKSTAYPAPIGVAASWDRELVLKVGESYGRDARARGVDFLLAPGVNIYRVPMNGRNFEYYGEDPYLAGETAVRFIQGVQSQGVAATVKHFAANNQENDRTGTSSDVDERTLREIYFPAFEAAVTRGKVRAVMVSYNLINGTYASENDWLQNQVLKKEWGFQGLVMSDWGATHSAGNAANHGLDLEMPGGDFFTQSGLGPLVRSGAVSTATIDDKVRRLLRVALEIGAFDRKVPTEPPIDDVQSGAVALQAAREGIVLLKNKGDLLPLSGLRRVAVIGPNADPAVVGGGGSSNTTPFHSVSVLDAIKKRAGSGISVDFDPGIRPLTTEVFRSSVFDGGLRAEYYSNKFFSGSPALVRQERVIDNLWRGSPAPDFGKDNFSIRWTGTITPKDSGDYELLARGDDGYRVYLDGKLVLDELRDQAPTDSTVIVHLQQGRSHAIKIEYYQAGGGAEMRFGYRLLPKDKFEKAAAIARQADIAIVCVGLTSRIETEGADRPFSLPRGQDDLIDAVIKANPRAIVVLNGGGAVDMTKWIDRVPALVMAWYPGQDGNTALAEILFGDISPTGKLPISLARRWEDCESYGNYPGVNHRVKYAEGIFVGYRHWDRAKVKALYPFGFGLSYTSFKYGGLTVEPAEYGEAAVRFTLQNTGKRVADEIAQIYVAPERPAVPRPLKELKGYERVHLEPGEKKIVTVKLEPRAFSYYDVKTHSWKLDRGRYGVWVGSSSRDIKLKGSLTWGEKPDDDGGQIPLPLPDVRAGRRRGYGVEVPELVFTPNSRNRHPLPLLLRRTKHSRKRRGSSRNATFQVASGLEARAPDDIMDPSASGASGSAERA